nr:immunoglobulin light chain junction region [Macaca mulatta]MOY03043.1 immunoglobulin light chain junction region [Macaca mulatta]MOY04154.1 immunoglobulin light chain junction region [Macaca mulatta]
CMQGSHLPWTF